MGGNTWVVQRTHNCHSEPHVLEASAHSILERSQEVVLLLHQVSKGLIQDPSQKYDPLAHLLSPF